MLTLIPFDDSRVVGARISGKITRPEFDKMVEKLEAALKTSGNVVLPVFFKVSKAVSIKSAAVHENPGEPYPRPSNESKYS